jgi:Transglycosylase SLT domain
MADYRAAARRAAQRYGLDPNVFTRQIQQESSFNPNARSPAGAVGIAQIMPATARGWGVDPTDPIASLNVAAKNMKGYVDKYGSYRNALVAYNAGPGRVGKSLPAETTNYIKTILGGGEPKTTSTRTTSTSRTSTTGSDGSEALLTALATLQPQAQAAQRPRVQITAPTAPSFSARPVTPTGYQTPDAAPAASTSAEQPKQQSLDVGAALKAIQALTPQATKTSSASGSPGPSTTNGRFRIDGPQPDRLKPELVSFAKKVAGVYGAPLTGKDGSTHSKLTVNGNVSEHYTGNATDIFQINGKPAQGERLLRAGRAALIAAGMPRAQAMKAGGGLYNVGSHQIIFLTNQGGNHYDHLHISSHGRRR